MNTVECEVIPGDGSAPRLRLPGGEVRLPGGALPTGVGRVVLGIRPEDLEVCAPDAAWFAGELSVVERLGSQTFGYLDIGGERMVTIEFPRTSSVRVGDSVCVASRVDHAHLFDPSTGRRLN